MKKFELWYPIQNFKITQRFGENQSPLYAEIGLKGHNGIDCVAAHGTPVRAAHDGVVVNAGIPDNREGYGVVLRTLEPFEYNGQEVYFKSIYWHLIPQIPVQAGQKVRVGDIIGYADNTGASSGDHLHFGIKPQAQGEADWLWMNIEQKNGYAGSVDPVPYFNGQYAEVGGLMYRIIDAARKVVEILKQLLKK